MKYGIGYLSVVPCRREPSDTSEQTTQLLFGETIKVYEQRRSWFRIKTSTDNYECWIDEKQFLWISQKEYESLVSQRPYVVSDFAQLITDINNSEPTTLLLGSNLPNFKKGALSIGDKKWLYEGLQRNTKSVLPKSKIKEFAMLFLNAPYQWGGRSPFGVDCSGLVQLVYKLNGINLPRDAYQQAELGEALSFIEEAEEGDLAFFDNSEGNITHVGIILNNNNIIHASGRVRIDRLDHQGIFNQEINNYTHQLRLISKIY